MDYENKYNEALKIARKWYDANTNEGYRGIFEEIFPELNETDDENARKEILDYIIKGSESCYDIQQYGRGKFGKWITWLKKQGEQKPVWNKEDEKMYNIVHDLVVSCKITGRLDISEFGIIDEWLNSIKDRIQSKQSNKPQGKTALEAIKEEKNDNGNKVAPKFHEGDWCIDNEDGFIIQIVKVLDNTYNYRTNEGKEYSCTHYSLEEEVRLWTIADAKECDVLISSVNKPFIYNGYFDEGSVGAYCGLYINDDFVKADKERYWTNNENIRPSTKEQRDFFFSKMKDAGYKWDSEQKQLITLNHFEDNDDMVEPKFKVGDIVQYITDSTDRRKIEEVDTLCNMYHTDSSPIMFEIEDEWKVVVNAEDVEQKPTDKIESKFKDGDWIVYKDAVWKVCNIGLQNYYELLKTNNEVGIRLIKDVDENAHLWTINDAKPGDIIYAESKFNTFDFIAIFSEIKNKNPWEYCSVDSDSDDYSDDLDHWEFDDHKGFVALDRYNFYPATKEQRDILFQKMKDAGYEWDAEKKELKDF